MAVFNKDILTEGTKSDLEKSRQFCTEVQELSKKYKLPFFFVTDGASAYSNNGNAAIKNARNAQIEWEKKNGFDPDEDWAKERSNNYGN